MAGAFGSKAQSAKARHLPLPCQCVEDVFTTEDTEVTEVILDFRFWILDYRKSGEMPRDWDSFRVSSPFTLQKWFLRKGEQRVLENPEFEFQSKIQNRKSKIEGLVGSWLGS
jgi:hypothetical protein